MNLGTLLPLGIAIIVSLSKQNFRIPARHVTLVEWQCRYSRLAAVRSEACTGAHDAFPGQVPFGERNFELVPVAVESFGRLGESGTEVIEEIAIGVVGGPNGGGIMEKGVVKERILRLISITRCITVLRG